MTATIDGGVFQDFAPAPQHVRHVLLPVVRRMGADCALGVRRLPVVNAGGGLEGIVTFDDVVELLAEELADLAKLVLWEQKRERRHRLASEP